MYNPFDRNPYSFGNYPNGSDRRNFETVRNLVQDGLNEMQKNPTDEIFRIWFDYSQKILSLATSNNPKIALDYLSYGQTLVLSYIPPYEKFNRCLDYLIELMRII